MEIGQRVHEVRMQLGLSLRNLAEKCGVSASMMSQIENKTVDPSISTLRKIAIALNVPVFSLVMENNYSSTKLVKKGDRRHISFDKGILEYEILHSDMEKKIAVMVGTLLSNGATSEELLSHEGEECLVILQGGLHVETSTEKIELSKDDSLYFDSSVPHRLVNKGKKPCRFYLIITPPKF